MSENLNTNNESPYSLNNFPRQEENRHPKRKSVILPSLRKPLDKPALPNRNNPGEDYIKSGTDMAERYANYHGNSGRTKEIENLETLKELPSRLPEDRNTTSPVGKVDEKLNPDLLSIPSSELIGPQDELGSGSKFDALVQELGDPTKPPQRPSH